VPEAALEPVAPASAEIARLPLERLLEQLEPLPHLNPDPPAATAPADPPLAAQKFYAAGRQSLLDGDNFGAVQAFDKALRLAPDHPAVLRSLGRAWTRAGNRVSAADFFRRALTADPGNIESALTLGRFAVEERQWDRAILNLHAALQLAERADAGQADVAAARLTRFYLANALNRAGYLAAAIDAYRDYLQRPTAPETPSPFLRELAIIDSQRGETLLLLGDALHRLGRPREAARSYLQAAAVGVLNPDPLRRRLVYTRLRLGQPRAAQALVAEAVAEAGDDATSTLDLVRYALQQGVEARPLSARLTQLYRDRGQPAGLALALSDVLPQEAALELLTMHLESQPGDASVFARLLDLLLDDPSTASSSRQQAVDFTVTAMREAPDRARQFALELSRRLADVADRSALLRPMPSDSPKRAASRAALRGVVLAEAGDAGADDAFEQSLSLWPETTWVLIELARRAAARGDYKAAEARLSSVSTAEDPEVVELRSRILLKTGRVGEAISLIDRALQDAPPGSPLMLRKAELLIAQERVAEAEQVLLDLLNARPTDEAIYTKLIELYDGRSDMLQNQQRLFRRMFETIPNARITRLVRLGHLLALRRYDLADQVLRSFDEDDPAKQELDRMRLETAVGLKRGEEVERLIDEHLAAAGDQPDEEMLRQAARFFQQAGDADRFLTLQDLIWRPKPASLQRSLILSQVHLQREEFAEAVDHAASALQQLEADNRQALDFASRVWAEALVKAGDVEAAAEALRDQIERLPEAGAELSNRLGAIYQLEGQPENSWKMLEVGLEAFPNDPSLNNSLGYGLAHRGVRLDEARQMLEIAVAAEPTNAAFLDSMGWVFYKLGDFDQARLWLERSRDAEPAVNPVILDHLGDTSYRLGQKPEAVRVWRQARTLLSAPNYQMFDPEEIGLNERLDQKIRAVEAGRPAVVAPLGEGVPEPAEDAP
jgi:tetratricopeptide (TPR) repeat protein